MQDTSQRVPAHLRRFVVEQDYGAYDAIDQAVWRFVLLQMYARLKDTAHPAYVEGLAQAGMSVERIPRIAEMDACLAEYGWGAVCVDGFIPPRAFFELQAHGILPIAADIRTPDHLAYTPAPDVIHEAAGHAPILPDPDYAAFLRRIGGVGLRAFASPRDAAVYDAIYELSVIKERWGASAREVAAAEQRLAALVAADEAPSEASLLARLYWWTVEYGLVGTPQSYKLYGAGLLSSLGESHFCHEPTVRKLPLTPRCVDYDYDITRAQPQLFVARDFAQLGEVLDAVSAGFAQRRGGLYGLEVARDSGEIATLELASGLRATGRVEEVVQRAGAAVLARLSAPVGIAGGRASVQVPAQALVVLGRLASGMHLHELTPAALREHHVAGDRLQLPLREGLTLEGRLARSETRADGCIASLELRDASMLDAAGDAHATARCTWLLAGGDALSVSAGGELGEPGEARAEHASHKSAPARRSAEGARARLLALYERAQAAYAAARDVPGEFHAVHAELARAHPDAWLLRWNLLESLKRLDLDPELQRTLVRELSQLERRFAGRYPIASGLRYLGEPLY